jgi:hypothetical protein
MYVAVAMIAQLPASAENDTLNELQMVMDEANAVCKYRMNTTCSIRCYQDGYFALQPITQIVLQVAVQDSQRPISLPL